MSKELKAPDKVTQKMTRDGAVAENLTTGETSSISERPQEENYSAPAGVAAEKVVQHIGAEIERHAAKGAEKKALDATQPKTHSSRLQFSEAERATPELQKAIKKSDKAADCLDAARAAIPKQTKVGHRQAHHSRTPVSKETGVFAIYERVVFSNAACEEKKLRFVLTTQESMDILSILRFR